MDLKKELENEVLLAILTRKRSAKCLDSEDSRELVFKIKVALRSDDLEPQNSRPFVFAPEIESSN